MGLSPMIYLNRYRVNVAKALLTAGQMNITDIALEVGFSTGGYFSRVFRQEVGCSPREYIQGVQSQ
jgi:AraC-like DNA-binding protein